MQPGDVIEVRPTELVAGGEALARIDGFPVFATNVYPGDIAVVRLTEVKKGFARAELVRLTSSSPLRRAAPCSIAEECGGCDWTALRLDAQLGAKEHILRESLRRIGKVQSHPPIALHPSPLNYRMRSRLHRDGDAVGFYAVGSNRVVPLARECEVVGLRTAQHPIEGQTWEIDGHLIRGNMEIEIRIDRFRYRLSTTSFFQVNRHLLSTMLRLVMAHANRVRQKRVAIDLFAGVGFFTLPLAKLFRHVIAIEGSPSIQYVRSANVDAIQSSVEDFDIPDADFIFLDPPRAGARKSVIDAMAQRAGEMICYLSCDPVTFSRDASRLIASGWRLATLDLLDLFPNTHHVETLASFERVQ
ncbi:MAG TPA: TRAM domain-containing protein [Thermoanaerobaculia bacterium]|nr:TRAM domain-containing protein [Thermoanaerobaculia bacterium]